MLTWIPEPKIFIRLSGTQGTLSVQIVINQHEK